MTIPQIITIYTPAGKKATCEYSQLKVLLAAGWTREKPEPVVPVKRTSVPKNAPRTTTAEKKDESEGE